MNHSHNNASFFPNTVYTVEGGEMDQSPLPASSKPFRTSVCYKDQLFQRVTLTTDLHLQIRKINNELKDFVKINHSNLQSSLRITL